MKKRRYLLLLLITVVISLLLSSCMAPEENNPAAFDSFAEETSSEENLLPSLPEETSSTFTESYNKMPIEVTDIPVNTDMLTEKYVKLEVANLLQNPELPNGCEITSLTTVLNFYGFNVTKTVMSDNYLPKSDINKDFWKVYIGDPRRNDSFGCYAQPITDAANKYLGEQGSNLKAYNNSYTPFEDLLSEVQKGNPVIMWGTLDMRQPYYSYVWTRSDGERYQWITPEHCFVLIGYDLEKGTAIISDPMRGISEHPLTTVKSRYVALYSQCVMIY